MYCKLFASLYQGTLRGCANEILVFTNLLAHADRFGIVDKHFKAIAEETGLDVEAVKKSITKLESPDPESRSPEEGGARLLRLDAHRVWGWKIVNYSKYRSIRNEDDRREQNRAAKEKERSKNSRNVSHCQPPSATVSHCQPPSAHADADADAEGDAKAIKDKLCTVDASRPASDPPPKARFQKRTLEEIKLQAAKIGLPDSEAERFFNYYESNGWRVGRNPMKSWHHALTNWKKTWQDRLQANGARPFTRELTISERADQLLKKML
jgi:hypothetical protein